MFGKKEMTRDESAKAVQAAETEPAIRPLMDIFEDKAGITLIADMPGVSKTGLNVQVEGDTLTIEGRVDIAMPDQLEALYADVNHTRYQRSFTLSREMDADRVEASLNNGLLTLRIPKRAELQPRKVEIKTH